jgi:hypothetical protein
MVSRPSTSKTTRRRATLIAALCCLLAIPFAAQASAISPSLRVPDVAVPAAVARGVLKGTVPLAPAKKYRSSVHIYQLAPTPKIISVKLGKTGAYSVKVSPGLYAVVMSGWAKGKIAEVARLALVKSGKTTKVRKLDGALVHSAATDVPSVRLSVGQITPPSDVSYLKSGLADLAIADTNFAAVEKCSKLRIYEDRKYGRFNDILNEIALGKSRYADAEFRAMSLRAEKLLKIHEPNYRLMGVVDKGSSFDGPASGRFWVVDPKTGAKKWSAKIKADNLWNLGGVALNTFIAKMCEKPKLPPFPDAYTGSVSLFQTIAGLTEKWTGNFTWTRTAYATNPDGSRNALYTLNKATVDTFEESGICTAATSSTSPTINSGEIEITVSPAGKWTTGVQLDTRLPDAMHQCPPSKPNTFTPRTVFNSASVTGTLAPMLARGAITGGGALKVFMTSGSASWNLKPVG